MNGCMLIMVVVDHFSKHTVFVAALGACPVKEAQSFFAIMWSSTSAFPKTFSVIVRHASQVGLDSTFQLNGIQIKVLYS